MKHRNDIFFVIAVMVIAISCKKYGNSSPMFTNTDYLTQETWKISKYEQKMNSTGTYVDQFPSEPACTQDDIYQFSTNFQYQLSEGATKCNPSDPDVIHIGTWGFLQNETQLRADNVYCNILKLDAANMILMDSMYLAPDTIFERITMVH